MRQNYYQYFKAVQLLDSFLQSIGNIFGLILDQLRMHLILMLSIWTE